MNLALAISILAAWVVLFILRHKEENILHK